jgi:FAD/FMN-containing dehydrogenase
MTTTRMHAGRLEDLRAGFTGSVLLDGDGPAYEEARTIFNAAIDRRPAVIAQCETTEDVAAAIRFGRDLGLEIAVRGGGHSAAGMALTDGGVVVDLRRMNAVSVDPSTYTARVGGGATMSHLDRATQPFGLATTGGRVSTTGVGGFTLNGGTGWLDRMFGLACDNLFSVELVTADGTVVQASERENPELFWSLHGGGGNFGVATSLTLRLHDLPTVTVALLLWRPEAGAEVVPAFRDFIESGPDELGGGILYLTGPPEEFVPEHLVGRLACLMLLTYAGDEAAAREPFRPMLALRPEGELIMEVPYAELQCLLDDPPGHRIYWSAQNLTAFPDEAAEVFCARAGEMLVPSGSQHALLPQGGAVARGNPDYPVPWRTSPWVVHPFGMWEDTADDDRAKDWVRQVCTAVQPWSMDAVYLNFVTDAGTDRVVAALGRENWERLTAVKAQYDPDNVFRLNHNIPPA